MEYKKSASSLGFYKKEFGQNVHLFG